MKIINNKNMKKDKIKEKNNTNEIIDDLNIKHNRHMLSVAMTKEHKSFLRKAAQMNGLTLSAWVISTLNKEAEKVLEISISKHFSQD